MELQTVSEVIAKFAGGLPKQIGTHLKDVEILVCESVDKANQELAELIETEDDGPLEPLAADTKGVFIGEPLEREESDDTEEMETIAMPEGVIVVVASNVATPEEGIIVLLHEIGHALAMSEEEVRQLGLGVAQAPQQGGPPNDVQSQPRGE